MNFTPRNVYRSSTSASGKVTTREYDFNDYATLEVGSFFLMLLGGAFLGVILAPILFIISILHFNGKNRLQFLAIAIISGYVVYDLSNHWLMWFFLDFGCSESTITFLIMINLGIMFTSIVLTILGGVIHSILQSLITIVFFKWVMFIFIIGTIFYLSITSLNPNYYSFLTNSETSEINIE